MNPSDLSPIEARAFELLSPLPHMQGVLLDQLRKGHEEHGGTIDRCGYSPRKLTRATAEEDADLGVYLMARAVLHGQVPPDYVLRAYLTLAQYLETELEVVE